MVGVTCPGQASGQERKQEVAVHASPSSWAAAERCVFTAPFFRLINTTALPHILRGLSIQERHKESYKLSPPEKNQAAVCTQQAAYGRKQ